MTENMISEITGEGMVSANEIEKRKKNMINFFKKSSGWIYYAILAVIIAVSTYIRTRNIPRLKDITTGTWTLGPDLDPFLFLRWAKYIAEHGKLFLLDAMRSVPLADICSGEACTPINTAGEMNLLSYMIAWLYKGLSIFDKEATVTYAAIILPVIMSVLAIIAFFLFARKIFYKEDKKIANLIALVATAFFALIPSILPRTIAGIPEKESAAFFFMFMTFYLFLESFTSEKLKRGLIFGVLSGATAGLLGLVWGGIDYVFIIMALAVLFAFLIGKIDENKFYCFGSWIAGFIIIAMPFSIRYSFGNLLASLPSELVFMTFFILLVDFLLFRKKLIKISEKATKIIPHQIVSLIVSGILLILLSSVIFGVSFVPERIESIIDQTIHPIVHGRFSVTVAENKPSYFLNDWKNEFGPVIFNIPLYFWMMILGSVTLFYSLIISLNKKEKRLLVFGYFIFIISLIFSKYTSHPHPLDGEGTLSLIVYFGGAVFFFASLGYLYYKRYRRGEFEVFKEFNFSYILYFVILTMTIVGARGAIRLIMVLGAVSPVVVGFLVVKIFQKYFAEKEDMKRLFFAVVALLIIFAAVFTLWSYYNSDKIIAENYAPGVYQWQWQKAMAWIRENTPLTSVFAHWWDYGYWVQSIGERATILDGGNAIGYWNYFMGRHVLTGTDEQTALDFLYAHNATHLLIDSTEIGKYGAFSSIGSDANYDRVAGIATVFMDGAQTQEKNNETIYVYQLGTYLSEDLLFKENGVDVLLPKNKAAVIGIMMRTGKDNKILQPIAVLMYNGKQYQMPLRTIYVYGKLYDFNSGFDAGLFIFPRLDSTSDGKATIVENGAAFYLNERVVHSQLARLYLFNEQSDYFKLVHREDSYINEDARKQGLNLGEFVYYSQAGFQGPIKIWEISYPSDIKLNQSYLDTEYPEELATVSGGS